MEIPWGGFWQKSRNRLKAGWLITAGLVAIYLGAVEPMNRMKGISSSRATGLAASADWQPSAMWHQMRPMRLMLQKGYARGVVRREPVIAASRSMAYVSTATILLGAAVGWRILRRAGRALFMPRARAA